MTTPPASSATVDLTAAGDFGTIGGAVFATDTTHSAGTGVFNTFVQIQANGTEQGYNTDASAQFNEKPGHTTSLLLANIPTVVGDGSNGTVEGMVYRQFVLDANEPNGGSKNLLSLDSLQIWQEESGNLTNFTPGSGFAGAHTNHLAYNMDAGSDAWVAINSGLSSGSGGADMVLLIPDSYFINNAANKYVTLYSAFGQQGSDWNSGGGFEEWGVRGGGSGAPGAPTPALTIDKIAAAPGGVADHAGEVINYTINVENTGNTNLTTVTLSDTLLKGPNGTLNAPIESLHADGILEVGETWTYKGTYTVQQADIDNEPTSASTTRRPCTPTRPPTSRPRPPCRSCSTRRWR